MKNEEIFLTFACTDRLDCPSSLPAECAVMMTDEEIKIRSINSFVADIPFEFSIPITDIMNTEALLLPDVSKKLPYNIFTEPEFSSITIYQRDNNKAIELSKLTFESAEYLQIKKFCKYLKNLQIPVSVERI